MAPCQLPGPTAVRLERQRLQTEDRVLTSPPADQHLSHHERNTDQCDTGKVGQNEGTASVLACEVRKPPDIAETNRRAGSRQNKYQTG